MSAYRKAAPPPTLPPCAHVWEKVYFIIVPGGPSYWRCCRCEAQAGFLRRLQLELKAWRDPSSTRIVYRTFRGEFVEAPFLPSWLDLVETNKSVQHKVVEAMNWRTWAHDARQARRLAERLQRRDEFVAEFEAKVEVLYDTIEARKRGRGV